MTETEKNQLQSGFFDIFALGNRLQLPVAHFWVKKLDWTGPVNIKHPFLHIFLLLLQLGIIRGNPGVFQLYPYPYPSKPLPSIRVRVFVGWGRVFLKTQGLSNYQGYLSNFMKVWLLKINLKISNDKICDIICQ